MVALGIAAFFLYQKAKNLSEGSWYFQTAYSKEIASFICEQRTVEKKKNTRIEVANHSYIKD